MTSLHLLHTRTFFPSSRTLALMRQGCLQEEQKGMTLESFIQPSSFLISELSPCLRAFACLIKMPSPLTITRFFFGNNRRTAPFFPLSFPERTITVSFFFTRAISQSPTKPLVPMTQSLNNHSLSTLLKLVQKYVRLWALYPSRSRRHCHQNECNFRRLVDILFLFSQ